MAGECDHIIEFYLPTVSLIEVLKQHIDAA
jgi:hypothetical protein